MYRTPLGMRNLSRIYILLTPLLMGPYYSRLAGVDHQELGTPSGVCSNVTRRNILNLFALCQE
jgi:hypothetical protein